MKRWTIKPLNDDGTLYSMSAKPGFAALELHVGFRIGSSVINHRAIVRVYQEDDYEICKRIEFPLDTPLDEILDAIQKVAATMLGLEIRQVRKRRAA